MPNWSWVRRRSARTRLAAPILVCALAAGVGSGALAPAPARALPAGETWAGELSIRGGDDTNVVAAGGGIRLGAGGDRSLSARSTVTEGELLLPPRRPAAAADRVAADVTADVPAGAELEVSVRGTQSDGSWGEWTPATAAAPATLADPAGELQAKVTFVANPQGASPTLTRLRLTADRRSGATAPGTTPRTTPPTTPGTGRAVDPAQPLAVQPFSTRVFATREGLVGGTTANGRRIVPRDHFAALPSRRGLSPNNTGDYTLVVCARNLRCAWAPVWDVGPWNTKDDYWNPSIARQSFQQLPQGLPEAQAAYQGRFNNGLDARGRRVANPAGLDLGDGTFWDDLQLRDNSWVTVSYLWTGRGVYGVARSGSAPTLVVRNAPTNTAASVGAVGNTARVAITCSATGQVVTGTRGTSNQWLRIGPNQYVAAAGVEAPRVSAC